MPLLSRQSIHNGPEEQGEEIGYMYGLAEAMVECTPSRASLPAVTLRQAPHAEGRAVANTS